MDEKLYYLGAKSANITLSRHIIQNEKILGPKINLKGIFRKKLIGTFSQDSVVVHQTKHIRYSRSFCISDII